MHQNKNKSHCGKKAFVMLWGIALTVAGFIVIPPLIDKYANKVYKLFLKQESINFAEMEPEIVPKMKRRNDYADEPECRKSCAGRY